MIETSTILSVGQTIPAFELPDEQGKPFNLPEQLEEKLMVLVFHRGGWCLIREYAHAAVKETRELKRG
jgi:peroxiredoxin